MLLQGWCPLLYKLPLLARNGADWIDLSVKLIGTKLTKNFPVNERPRP